MNPKDREMLEKIVGLLIQLRAPNDVEKVSRARKPGYMEMFSRFPKDLRDAMKKAITPEDRDMHEALLCACVWLSETEQKLEKAGDKIDMLQKQKTTHDAQLFGQRDRMNVMTNQIDILYKNMDQVLDKLAKMDERIISQGVKLAAQQNTSSLHDRQIISQSKVLVELKDRTDSQSEHLYGHDIHLTGLKERLDTQIGRIDGHAMSILEIRGKVSSLEKVFVSVPSTQEK